MKGTDVLHGSECLFSSVELGVIRESWILDCLTIGPRGDVPSIAGISNL